MTRVAGIMILYVVPLTLVALVILYWNRLIRGTERYKLAKKSSGKLFSNCIWQMAVTKWNNEVKTDMEVLCKKHGVNAFLFFTSWNHSQQFSDVELYEAFEHCRNIGALAMLYPDNAAIRHKNMEKLINAGVTGPEGFALSSPEELEVEAVERGVMIASQTNCPLYVVHLMSKASADVVSRARSQGCVVFGEANLAAVATDGSHYFNDCPLHASSHVLIPPLRFDPTNSTHLLHLLNNNDLQTISSNHCSYTQKQKAVGVNDFRKIPPGVNGVESLLPVLWEKGVLSGKMDPCQYVAITSTNASKIFNLYPKKGRISVGSDADIVIFDANQSFTVSKESHAIASDFNVFEGYACSGRACAVLLSGKMAYDSTQRDNTLLEKASAKFVKAMPWSNYFYPKIQFRNKLWFSKKAAKAEEKTSVQKSSIRNKSRNTESSILFDDTPTTSPVKTYKRPLQPPGGKTNFIW